MPQITTETADIYYEEKGKGETLVLIPGLGAHSRIWGPFPEMFSKGRRVVTYDPRGLGKSSAGNQPLTLDLMVSDAAAVLDAAGGDEAIVLGASLGSLVALKFALDYPGRARKLILVTPALFRTRHGDWLLETLSLFSDRLSSQEFITALMPLAFAPPFFEKGYGMIREVGRMLTPSPGEMDQIRRQLECLRRMELPREFRSIDCPVLILAGRRDVLAPVEDARLLASKLRHSRLVVFPDAGHSLFVEATEGVSKEIIEFLRS